MSSFDQPIQESRHTRRDFTLNAALALLAGCVITISEACGSDSPTTPSNPPADVNGVISANHGHVAVVTTAQMTTGSALSLSVQGTAAHNHTLSLSQGNRQSVTHDSTSDPSNTFGLHLHSVSFTPI
jgi:hypothetical protein